MHICLDLSVLRTRPTGVGYYGYFLAKALNERAAESSCYLAFDGLRFARLEAFLDAYANRSALATSVNQALWNTVAPVSLLRTFYRQVKRAAFVRGCRGLDLVHAITYAPPAHAGTPWLPLLHDLSHVRAPHFHPVERVRFLERTDRRIGEAALVNTVSEFSRGEIVTLLGVPQDRVRVTYPGVDPIFAQRKAADPAILSHYGLKSGRFLLSVATIEPRKNVEALVLAFARLAPAVRKDAVLLLTGQGGWRGMAFPKDAESLQRQGTIRFTGYVSSDHLRVFYQNCALFLYPSHYEGFGIPVVEAHFAGAPAAISFGSGVREAAAGLAREIRATDIEGWSSAMREAIETDAWSHPKPRALRAAAAAPFTWRRNAQLTQALYEEIHGRVAAPLAGQG